MKLNCDNGTERKEKWHKWFAWYPVLVGKSDCRWLEHVEKKSTFYGDDMMACWDNEYRAIK